LGSLKYFDKLYSELANNNCEVIYGFWQNNEYINKMIEYCEETNRKYYGLNYQGELFFNRMRYRSSVKKMLDKLKPDMVIQTNDMHFFQNEIVHQAKERKIPTLAIQWAFTAPEELHMRSKQRNQNLDGTTVSKIEKVIKENIFYINKIVNKLLGLEYGDKLSIAQGDSDKVAVINEYSKDLLIKQGVNKEKIVITGHLDFDNAVANTQSNTVTKSDNIKILYISQPFYVKDLKRVTLTEQIEYVKKIYSSVDNLFDNYRLYLKLHPAECIEDYSSLNDLPNLVLKENFDKEISINNSDLVISSSSTLVMSAISAKKPVITLNILNIPEVEDGLIIMGIEDQIVNSWEHLHQYLQLFKENPKRLIRKINPYFLLTDGLCKRRTIDLILGMIQIQNGY
jgi:hypothetical protein